MSKRLLVTGVAGFIGSHVAKRLAKENYEVIGVDDLSRGHERNIPGEIEFIKGDLADPAFVNRLPGKIEVVLHLAGQSSGEMSFDDPVLDLGKNTISTLNLILWAMRQKCERFLYASTMSVYGTNSDQPIREDEPCYPLSCYGVGKLASEGYLSVYSKKIPSIAFRMFNVYGPGQDMANLRQGMVSIFVAQAVKGGKIHVKGSLDRFRDIIFIDDVVEAWVRGLKAPLSGNLAVNVGTGVRTTVGQLLEAIASHVPGISWYSEGGTSGDQFGIYADTTRLREVTGMEGFVPLAKGLGSFISWAKQPL